MCSFSNKPLKITERFPLPFSDLCMLGHYTDLFVHVCRFVFYPVLLGPEWLMGLLNGIYRSMNLTETFDGICLSCRCFLGNLRLKFPWSVCPRSLRVHDWEVRLPNPMFQQKDPVVQNVWQEQKNSQFDLIILVICSMTLPECSPLFSLSIFTYG